MSKLLMACGLIAIAYSSVGADVPSEFMAAAFKVESEFVLKQDAKSRKVQTSNGSGFGIDLKEFGVEGKRYVLTNAHVVFDQDSKGHYKQGEVLLNHRLKAVVVAVDHEVDLCLLKTDELPHVFKLAAEMPQPGAEVVLLGGPGAALAGPYRGYYVSGAVNGGVSCQIAVQFWHGCSGSALIRGDKVFAVAVSGVRAESAVLGASDIVPGVALAIPCTTVRAFLEKHLKGLKE